MSDQDKPRLRPVKLVIRPIFVLDDGDELTEIAGGLLTLKPSELASFAERWPELVEEFEKGLGSAKGA